MQNEKQNKREQAFELEKYVGKRVQVSFLGGIQVCGQLKRHDPQLNLVLEDAKMTKTPDMEYPGTEELLACAPSTITCKGASISSIDLLDR